jgi:hypothetical protein
MDLTKTHSRPRKSLFGKVHTSLASRLSIRWIMATTSYPTADRDCVHKFPPNGALGSSVHRGRVEGETKPRPS